MSWIFFILRYDGVLMKICLETKNVLEIMNDSNFTVAGRITSFLYFSQILLKGILKIYKYEQHAYCPNIMYQKPLPETSPKFRF